MFGWQPNGFKFLYENDDDDDGWMAMVTPSRHDFISYVFAVILVCCCFYCFLFSLNENMAYLLVCHLASIFCVICAHLRPREAYGYADLKNNSEMMITITWLRLIDNHSRPLPPFPSTCDTQESTIIMRLIVLFKCHVLMDLYIQHNISMRANARRSGTEA